MLSTTVYGFAKEDDVDEAIDKRMQELDLSKPELVATVLGEAVAALKDINAGIPHHSRHRHFVAGALECFCNSGS